MEGTNPVNKKLAAALSGGAVLVLALSGCSSDDSNEKLDAWAKKVCDAVQPQAAEDRGRQRRDPEGDLRQQHARRTSRRPTPQAFQDISDAYKAIGTAVNSRGRAARRRRRDEAEGRRQGTQRHLRVVRGPEEDRSTASTPRTRRSSPTVSRASPTQLDKLSTERRRRAEEAAVGRRRQGDGQAGGLQVDPAPSAKASSTASDRCREALPRRGRDVLHRRTGRPRASVHRRARRSGRADTMGGVSNASLHALPSPTAPTPPPPPGRPAGRRLHRRRSPRPARRARVRRAGPQRDRARAPGHPRRHAARDARPAVPAAAARARTRACRGRAARRGLCLASGWLVREGRRSRSRADRRRTALRRARAARTGSSSPTWAARSAGPAASAATDEGVVLGVGGASTTLAGITVRTPVGSRARPRHRLRDPGAARRPARHARDGDRPQPPRPAHSPALTLALSGAPGGRPAGGLALRAGRTTRRTT